MGKKPPTVETVCNRGPRSKLTQWECKDRSPSEGSISWACEGASRKILNTYIYHKNQPNVGIYIYPYMDPMGNISQPWGKENHFQKCFGKGYVSSQEGNSNANVWFQAAKVLTERILSQIIDMKFEVKVFGVWKLWVKTLPGCVTWGNVLCA